MKTFTVTFEDPSRQQWVSRRVQQVVKIHPNGPYSHPFWAVQRPSGDESERVPARYAIHRVTVENADQEPKLARIERSRRLQSKAYDLLLAFSAGHTGTNAVGRAKDYIGLAEFLLDPDATDAEIEDMESTYRVTY